MRAHGREQSVALGDRVRIQHQDASVSHERDTGEDFLRRLRTNALERRQLSALRGRLQIRERRNPELRVELVNLLDTESGNADEFYQAFRRCLAELLEVLRLARLHEIANDGERGGSETANTGELSGSEQGREIVRSERQHAARGPLIRARLEAILSD